MQPFDHYTPQTVPEALDLLARLNGQGVVNAGGTDLMLKMKAGFLKPAAIINIKQLNALQGITFNLETGLKMGALTTLRNLTRSLLIQQHYPCLATAAGVMASEQIRSFATVGGNLCNGSPSADLAPPLIALEGTAVIATQSGTRYVPMEKFFLAPGKTALHPGELLQAIHIPPPSGQTVYLKHAPRAFMDIAVVGVAVRLQMADGICQQAGIVLGAVAPTPLRVQAAEEILVGQAVLAPQIQQAADIAEKACSPIDDVRGSAWYRRQMVNLLVRRGVEQCLQTTVNNK
ncbi:MAG: xanthine dehydrogenase family protein subunit M [Aestuariibacter sp.]|nr:xanthine dehydrogenase family protein subunit M [Aestuariibacter sp.]